MIWKNTKLKWQRCKPKNKQKRLNGCDYGMNGWKPKEWLIRQKQTHWLLLLHKRN